MRFTAFSFHRKRRIVWTAGNAIFINSVAVSYTHLDVYKRQVLDELNYQFLRRLQKEGFITLKSLFIDGTKIEANANRYTFVWRGTLNYHLAGLLDTVDSVYQKYNALIDENEYSIKYDIPHAHMFVIDLTQDIHNHCRIRVP